MIEEFPNSKKWERRTTISSQVNIYVSNLIQFINYPVHDEISNLIMKCLLELIKKIKSNIQVTPNWI